MLNVTSRSEELEAMLIIYKMTFMEDRELFRLLKEERAEERDRL
jgi:hypothetical protein